MIYISSSCIKSKRITESINSLVCHGFSNIELTGGTTYYNDIENDLLIYYKEKKINFLCHNYFPPPKENFVLNIASLNKSVFERSFKQIEKAIDLSQKLGCNKFGFHAGFMLDILPDEIGKKISNHKFWNREKCMQQFCNAYNSLKQNSGSLELYIENNVISDLNFKSFNYVNPFFLASHKDYIELKKMINFKILLDIGHLKVSAKTLKLDFKKELDLLIEETDYIHISDNDSFSDNNKLLVENSVLWNNIFEHDIKGKTITVEIYEPIEMVKKTYTIFSKKCGYE